MSRARQLVSPMEPPRAPRNIWSRVGSWPAAPSALRMARGVAAEVASAKAGTVQVVMAPEKATSIMTRAVMAGLAKFWPMPPKNCLTTTMATKEPKAACQRGMDAGRFRARIRPVTAADRSVMVQVRFVIFSKAHSHSTATATQTTSTSRAWMPKNTIDAITAGNRAMSTSRMMV